MFAAHFQLSQLKFSTVLGGCQQIPINLLQADPSNNAKLKSEHKLQG